MKKRALALLIATALCLAGCAGPLGLAPPPGDLPDEDRPIDQGEPPVETPTLANTQIPSDTETAIRHFSEKLLREVLTQGDENPVISPLSAYYALAMAALGTGGETLAEFSALLSRDPQALAADLMHLTQNLADTGGSTALRIGGSVWTAEDFPVNPTFQQAMADYFDAPAHTRDFAAPETVDEINAWAAEQTEGLIDPLIASIGRDAVMLLINTLYLSAKWAEHFNPMTAYRDTFYPEGGQGVETDFLSTRADSFPVTIADHYEAALLPYDDGRLGFLLVRPTDDVSVRDFAANHDLSEIMQNLTERAEVRIRMPKLDLEYEILLNELLQNLGLVAAFGDGADFSGISAVDEPLRISSVLQKVRILVDEEGTEAAAATVIEIERTSLSLDLLKLNFNTPYLFAVYDLEAGIPLFVGVLDHPGR